MFRVISFKTFGDPSKVLGIQSIKQSPLPSNSIRFRTIAFPINPSDINQIQGIYPSKPIDQPDIGYIPGNEGLVQVEEIGSDVVGWKKGDWALPQAVSFGTWRTGGICKASDLFPISKDVSPEFAATILVNPCSAYRMLKDFVNLKSGDVIIQNGANSVVGMCVIQLAKLWGIQTINVISPNVDELIKLMKEHGATHVILDTELDGPKLQSIIEAGPPKLGLNCVGGKNATSLSKTLAENGCLVTYGAMAKEAVILSPALLIFKTMTATGFWMTKWSKEHDFQEKKAMVEELFELNRKHLLKDPYHFTTEWDSSSEKSEILDVILEKMNDSSYSVLPKKHIVLIK